MRIGELSLEDAARQAAGNWRRFDSFCWYRASDLKDADRFTIVYSHHRDSGLLDQSNAAVIEEALRPFMDGDDPDVVAESHSHFAVGWINGFCIRVYRRGRITKAFRTYHALAERLADCGVLDSDDYSRREYEATVANVGEAAWKLKRDYVLPDNWQSQVYDWFSDTDCSAIESSDDRGGWPSEAQLQAAFQSLGFQQAAA